jgi:hypothetical protein
MYSNKCEFSKLKQLEASSNSYYTWLGVDPAKKLDLGFYGSIHINLKKFKKNLKFNILYEKVKKKTM